MDISSKLATKVWLMLCVATLGTWLIAEQGSLGGFNLGQTAVPFIFLIVVFKVRLVLLYFMELKTAPIVWQVIFELWAILGSTAIVLLYLLN